MWRALREGRDPLARTRPGGRWDDGTFDVLYTSETRDGVIVERRFHLHRGQPLPPSRLRYALNELAVRLDAVMPFSDLDAIAAVGLDTQSWGRASHAGQEREHPRPQNVAEACTFLGAHGIVVPGAREPCSSNLIVLCKQDG